VGIAVVRERNRQARSRDLGEQDASGPTSLVLSPPAIAARIGSDGDQSSIFDAVCGAAISLVGSV
jgi:hypothetical protein